MQLKPAQTCLGLSLLVGVEVACAATLILSLLLISLCSSTEPLQISSIVVPPEIQVFAAAWAFLGIPSAVVAGVGVLHRIEQAVRVFFFFQCASFVLTLFIPIWFVMTNSVCDLVVHPDLQSQGTAFVCGFANTFIVIWGFMFVMVQVYMLYIVWSAAEDIGKNPFPELYRYEEAVRSVSLPARVREEPPGPKQMARAAQAGFRQLEQTVNTSQDALDLRDLRIQSLTAEKESLERELGRTNQVRSVQFAEADVGVPPISAGQEGAHGGGAQPRQRTPVSALLSEAAAEGQQYMFGASAPAGVQRRRSPVSELLSEAAAEGQSYRFGPAADEGTPQSFIPSPPPGARFQTTSRIG